MSSDGTLFHLPYPHTEIMPRYEIQSVEVANMYAGMACNTSADQYLFLTMNLNSFAPLNELELGFMNPHLNLSGPLPIGAAVAIWSEILNDLMYEIFFPSSGRSVLYPSLVAHNLSFLGWVISPTVTCSIGHVQL